MSATLPRSRSGDVRRGRAPPRSREADERVRRTAEVAGPTWAVGPANMSAAPPRNMSAAAEAARHRGAIGPANMSTALPRSRRRVDCGGADHGAANISRALRRSRGLPLRTYDNFFFKKISLKKGAAAYLRLLKKK